MPSLSKIYFSLLALMKLYTKWGLHNSFSFGKIKTNEDSSSAMFSLTFSVTVG